MTKSNDSKKQQPKPDYEIGYGRPPTKTQFQPGQSGNPKGRKRRPKSVQAQMQKILSKKVSITEGGGIWLLAIQEVILRSAVNKAAKGDLKAAAFVFRLRDAPEFANTDTIDQDSLSPDDQAMLDEMMRQFSETDKSDQSILSGSIDEESTMNECLADSDENQATPRNPVAEVDVDDG